MNPFKSLFSLFKTSSSGKTKRHRTSRRSSNGKRRTRRNYKMRGG